jgi:Mu transposase-like protein
MREVREVLVRSTSRVRFETNDYSAPVHCVGSRLSLYADPFWVQHFAGLERAARHPRSCARQQIVEGFRHYVLLLLEKLFAVPFAFALRNGPCLQAGNSIASISSGNARRSDYATLLLGRGFNPKIVSEMLVHNTVANTLDLYSHVLATMQRDASDALERLLFPAMRTMPRMGSSLGGGTSGGTIGDFGAILAYVYMPQTLK